ncbi:MAG: ABC transporter substrate-binding protein [Gammaproteobacteria bacterium]|nr:ABC transporter substrate-binding protein [Gammaproteobacteria bacterium]
MKVGVILTYSGGAAHLGQQIDRGLNLYLKQHASELGEHKIELIKRDSKRPGGDVAKTAVQELITREDVDILTGFVFSPNAIASAPLATQGKVPMVIMNAGTAWIPSLSPYIVRVSFTMWQAAYPMGGYAKRELGCNTAAVGYTDYPPGKDSLAAFKKGFETAGGELVDAVPMGGPREVPDFTPFFQRVKDAKPDCLYIFVPAGNHATAVAKIFADLGMAAAGIRLIGSGDITPDTKLQDMGDDALGVITMHHYSADYETPINQEFVKTWKSEYGQDSTPDFMGVAGWDGMAAIFHVIRTLDGKISAEGAIDALKGWTFDSPRGKIMIDPETRDIIHDEHVHEVVKRGDRLAINLVETIPQVKDPCKVLKIGKCGQ